MPRYRDEFRKMLAENEELFKEFTQVHADYEQNQKKYQAEFNRVGAQVMLLVEDCERRLCGKTERGKYATFSSKLAEKFRNEVKAFYPMIDFVGVKAS